jgi:DNA invertase Pin-like site-specific DNA recombinase
MAYDKRKRGEPVPPQPGWAVYLRTSSDENQKPELSRARQRFVIEENVLKRSEMPVFDEYIDVLTGTTPNRPEYQRLLNDARMGKFSHVIVERADRFGRNDTEAMRAIDELHEFGVAVRFANMPDIDPMHMDQRVLVTMTFTLARRESQLLGVRVKGGLRAKLKAGGFANLAPDGYINMSGKTDLDKKKDLGRVDHWIELDPERAPIWRYAWELLLEDRLTLPEIAEALHARGYRHLKGRPFVEIAATGKRKAIISTLSHVFHNWTYAGWVVSESNGIPPKTLRGNWEPLISTEEFERGLEILERRNSQRTVRRKQEYLLSGLIYYRAGQKTQLRRLTGSTSNAGRSSGGTAYYRIAETGGASFLCAEIDELVARELTRIQVDPDMLPLIRVAYTHDLNTKIGGSRPDERTRLEAILKGIDEEENRTARLFASGKISEEVWNGLWAEWQDRRSQVRRTLDTLSLNHQVHVDNLEMALQIIARIGELYNGLERGDQKELLRQVVHRVVVNDAGNVSLELRTPFAYLRELTDEIRNVSEQRKRRKTVTKNGGAVPAVSSGACSNLLQSCWKLTPASAARSAWLDCVPNHSSSFSCATPIAPTTICADPVRTSAPF